MNYRSNWLQLPQDADEAQVQAVRDYAATLPEGQPCYAEVTGGEVWNAPSDHGRPRRRFAKQPKRV